MVELGLSGRLRSGRLVYGASEADIAAFIEADSTVKVFMNKYQGTSSARYIGRGLCIFFKWLKVVKHFDIGPSEFVDLVVQKRASPRLQERMFAKSLVLEFSRDNPDLKSDNPSSVYAQYYLPIAYYLGFNEVPLTGEAHIFHKLGRRKYGEPAFTVDLARKVIGYLSQRDRAICMCMLQSGQSIGQIVEVLNTPEKSGYVMDKVRTNPERIRLDFKERKGNNSSYFTFLSVDAIQELSKWLIERERWLDKINQKSGLLWITQNGTPLTAPHFQEEFREMARRHKLYTGPYTVRTHMFRKIFLSEGSPPSRGITRSYLSFMMGHVGGLQAVEQLSRLDSLGGVYDNANRIYPDAVEREYQKLEPYINIFSNPTSLLQNLTKETNRQIYALLKALDEGRIKISGPTR